MTPFVADASIALSWFLDDRATPFAEAVRARLRQTTAVVPAIWPLEVVNAVVLGVRRGRLSAAQAERVLRLLQLLPIEIEDVDFARITGAVSMLAVRTQLTVYDASYVELAVRRGLPLATLDARMRAAAEGLGVPPVDEFTARESE